MNREANENNMTLINAKAIRIGNYIGGDNFFHQDNIGKKIIQVQTHNIGEICNSLEAKPESYYPLIASLYFRYIEGFAFEGDVAFDAFRRYRYKKWKKLPENIG